MRGMRRHGICCGRVGGGNEGSAEIWFQDPVEVAPVLDVRKCLVIKHFSPQPERPFLRLLVSRNHY
jgi:hypothetical protein